eukprot:jgi/Mesvir1/2516/Mv01484-RA.1
MQASHQAIWKRGGPHPLPSRGGNRDIDAAPTAATAFCGIRDPPPYDPDPTGGENNVAWSGDNNSFGFSVNDRSVRYPPRMDAGVDKDYVVKAPDGDESAFRRITQGDGKCMFNALLIVDAFRKGETVTSEQVVQRTLALKEEPGGSNAIIIPRASNDTVHVHTMAENWSFQAIGKLLGGQPSLYDILKPLNSSTRLSVGVYYAHPEHGHNQTASKIIGHPIHGDVLLIKTYDDGESPTKVRCITEYDLGVAVRSPKDLWLPVLCAETQEGRAAPAPTCRRCGRPYSSTVSREDVCACTFP